MLPATQVRQRLRRALCARLANYHPYYNGGSIAHDDQQLVSGGTLGITKTIRRKQIDAERTFFLTRTAFHHAVVAANRGTSR